MEELWFYPFVAVFEREMSFRLKKTSSSLFLSLSLFPLLANMCLMAGYTGRPILGLSPPVGFLRLTSSPRAGGCIG